MTSLLFVFFLLLLFLSFFIYLLLLLKEKYKKSADVHFGREHIIFQPTVVAESLTHLRNSNLLKTKADHK